jgi:hypothetical protein
MPRKPKASDITPEVTDLLEKATSMILRGDSNWNYKLPDGSEVEDLTAVQAAQLKYAYGGGVRYTGSDTQEDERHGIYS